MGTGDYNPTGPQGHRVGPNPCRIYLPGFYFIATSYYNYYYINNKYPSLTVTTVK